jgi:hypothetical protein
MAADQRLHREGDGQVEDDRETLRNRAVVDRGAVLDRYGLLAADLAFGGDDGVPDLALVAPLVADCVQLAGQRIAVGMRSVGALQRAAEIAERD